MMNQRNLFSAILCCSLAVAVLGCGSSGDNPARKDIRRPTPPPPVPRRIADPIDPALREKAISELNAGLQSSDFVMRANAIEGLQESIGAEARPQILHALEDEHPLVRFAAAMAAGAIPLPEARPTLQELANDANPSVRVAARYGLHRLGDTHFSHDLEKYSQDPDRAVRANTAFVLGRLGEKSALVILRSMVNDPESLVRIQVAEAMWRLGDMQGLENLMAASISQAPDDQMVSLLALAAPKDDRVGGLEYGKLVADYPEVSLTAARALGILGSDRGYTVAMNATRDPDPRRRVLAALALGAIGRSDAQPTLRRLLGDADQNVRVAAATAFLQLKPPRAT